MLSYGTLSGSATGCADRRGNLPSLRCDQDNLLRLAEPPQRGIESIEGRSQPRKGLDAYSKFCPERVPLGGSEQAQQHLHLPFDIMISHDRWHVYPLLTGVPEPRPAWPGAFADFGRVSPALQEGMHIAVPSEDLLISGRDVFSVVLDVLDGGLDVLWGKAKQAGNLIVAPALLYVIHDVIDRDTSSFDFWSAPTINNLGSHGLFSLSLNICNNPM
jgi:hypothetical protein